MLKELVWYHSVGTNFYYDYSLTTLHCDSYFNNINDFTFSFFLQPFDLLQCIVNEVSPELSIYCNNYV